VLQLREVLRGRRALCRICDRILVRRHASPPRGHGHPPAHCKSTLTLSWTVTDATALVLRLGPSSAQPCLPGPQGSDSRRSWIQGLALQEGLHRQARCAQDAGNLCAPHLGQARPQEGAFSLLSLRCLPSDDGYDRFAPSSEARSPTSDLDPLPSTPTSSTSSRLPSRTSRPHSFLNLTLMATNPQLRGLRGIRTD
jgi:hypothetical protein